MKTLAAAACAHLAAPGIAEPFLARAISAIERAEALGALVDELRAERHRAEAQQAQLAMEVARLRNLLDGLETAVAALEGTLQAQLGSEGSAEPKTCTCRPSRVRVWRRGGICNTCAPREER